ncbi:MAG TPA: hypothetical protein VLR26_10235 [Frankiaceae bacterium]|nr:hypothetical protein [Frankiaceae bacterium]
MTGGAKTSGGTVTEQHADTFQGRQAREATIHVPSANADYHLEAFIDGTRLYNIVADPQSRFDSAKASFTFS